MVVCDVPMQQPATSCSSKSHIAIRPHIGSNNDQCFSCSHSLPMFSSQRNIILHASGKYQLVWCRKKKKRRLMRGWGKHHFLMLAADLRKKYFLRETIKRQLCLRFVAFKLSSFPFHLLKCKKKNQSCFVASINRRKSHSVKSPIS